MTTFMMALIAALVLAAAFAVQQWIEYRRARALELPSSIYNRTYRPPSPKIVMREYPAVYASSAIGFSTAPGAVWPVNDPREVVMLKQKIMRALSE